MTNDDISCFLYFSVIPSKKSRCFWLSNSGGLRLTTLQKLRVVIQMLDSMEVFQEGVAKEM